MKKKIKIIFVVISIIISGVFTNSSAQRLEDYLKIAAENNSALKSKFYSYLSSLERIPQAGALPDPELSFGIFIEPMQRFMGNQVAEFSLMQMFPWFGTLGYAEDEAAAMAKARYEEFNEEKSMLFYEVKSTWYALYLLEKEIKIMEENINILETLEEIALSRLKSGESSGSSGNSGIQINKQTSPQNSSEGMSGMDMSRQTSSQSKKPSSGNMSGMGEMSGSNGNMINVLRIQIEINELRNSLALLIDSRKPLLTQFNRLLNRDQDELVDVPDSIAPVYLPAPLSEIPDSIKINNPMIRMLEMEEEAFLAEQEMNKKMGLPMIGLGVQYSVFQQRPGSMMEGKNMIMPMATISIPIWRSKYNASVQEAELKRKAVVEQKADEQKRLMVSYEDALKNFKDAERRYNLYLDQSELSQQALDILTIQYTAAGSDFEEVLRMQQQLLDYRLRRLDAVVDQNIASAMIERLMGR